MIDSNVYKLKDKKTGQTVFPGTVTDGVAHLQTKTDLTTLISEYDVTSIWPNNGIDVDGIYDLRSAILVLEQNLKDSQKILGVTVKFLDINNKWEIWKYCDSDYKFSEELGWIQLELDTIMDLQKEKYYNVNLFVESGKALVEVDTEINNIEFTWDITYKGDSVNKRCKKYFNELELDLLSENTIVTIDKFTEPTKIDYTLDATFHKMNKSTTVSVVAVHPSYYGIVPNDFELSEEAVLNIEGGLIKVLIPDNKLEITKDNLIFQKICFVYPKYFDKLNTIRDNNGIDWESSFTRTELVINNVEYYGYILTDSVSISKEFKLIFS